MDREDISEQEKNIMISRGQVVDPHAPKETKSDYGITRPEHNTHRNSTINEFDPNIDEKLRVDQIDSQVGRVSNVASVNAVTGVSAVSAATSPVDFADALDQWRSMSERYRNQRLARENAYIPQKNQEANQSVDQNYNQQDNEDEYIKSYTKDNNKIEEKTLLDDNKHKNDINTINHLLGLVQSNSEIEEAPTPKTQDFKEKINSDIRERILGRLSTANLDIDPNLVYEYDESNEEISDGEDLKVSDIMTRNVISVIDSMTIEQVASIFNKKNITGVPVIHYKTKLPIGIITMSDILEHVFSDGFASSMPIQGNPVYQNDSLVILDRPVSDIMNTQPLLVTSNATVQEVCQEMVDKKRHRALVIDNSRVRGIFTSFDAVKAIGKYGIGKK